MLCPGLFLCLQRGSALVNCSQHGTISQSAKAVFSHHLVAGSLLLLQHRQDACAHLRRDAQARALLTEHRREDGDRNGREQCLMLHDDSCAGQAPKQLRAFASQLLAPNFSLTAGPSQLVSNRAGTCENEPGAAQRLWWRKGMKLPKLRTAAARNGKAASEPGLQAEAGAPPNPPPVPAPSKRRSRLAAIKAWFMRLAWSAEGPSDTSLVRPCGGRGSACDHSLTVMPAQEELARVIYPHLPQGGGTESYLHAVQQTLAKGNGVKALLIFWCRPLMSVLDANWPTRREMLPDDLPDGALGCRHTHEKPQSGLTCS